MYNLDDKVAVITGENSGISSAIAMLLKNNAAKIVIFDKYITGTDLTIDGGLSGFIT
jgi:NADP-dependent 3-hydroxy acid dehydrogenase YdfG